MTVYISKFYFDLDMLVVVAMMDMMRQQLVWAKGMVYRHCCIAAEPTNR